MEVIAAVVVAAVCGMAAGGIATLIWCRSRRRAAEAARLVEAPAIADDLAEAMMAVLRSAAMLVGQHDEVIHASPQARAMGIARGTRLGVPELLCLVREARSARTNIVRDMSVPRGVGSPPVPVSARVANLGGGALLVLAYDLSPELRIDASRRDFVANISHELKTPIGAIAVLAEAIEAASDSPEQVERFASRLQFETRRLGELVGQIIDLSRLQADDPLLSDTPVDIADVVGEAVLRNREIAASRHVAIVTNLSPGCVVLGDQWQLTDAVSNLIANAIAYSDERARVAISTRLVSHDEDEAVEVSVADNGLGIKAEDQERVFERFFRVDYGRSRESGGTGLGLSIVKHIAAAHGGSVSLWSRVGQGSTFTVRLPAVLPAPTDKEDG